MTRSALLASCILAAATALSARGQSLLDQQLGPAPATQKVLAGHQVG